MKNRYCSSDQDKVRHFYVFMDIKSRIIYGILKCAPILRLLCRLQGFLVAHRTNGKIVSFLSPLVISQYHYIFPNESCHLNDIFVPQREATSYNFYISWLGTYHNQ